MKLVLENGWLWVVEGIKGGCCGVWEAVKPGELAGLVMFLPQGCVEHR